MSEETKMKIRASKKGKGNHRVGTKHTEETKKKIALSMKGDKNPMFGNKIGHKHKEETKIKLSLLLKQQYLNNKRVPPMLGKKFSTISVKKMSDSHRGKIFSEETKQKLSDSRKGEKHWNWKFDRNSLKISEKKHLCGKYREWMKSVKKRDNWKCKISNEDCKGRLESHHILNWVEYPELRYQTNNGITLCHAHHPRKRAEEKRLIPIFMELVSVSKK